MRAEGLKAAGAVYAHVVQHVVQPFANKQDIDWAAATEALTPHQLRAALAATHALLSTLSVEDLCCQTSLPVGHGCLLLDVLAPMLVLLTHPSVPEHIRHAAYVVFKAWAAALAHAADKCADAVFGPGETLHPTHSPRKQNTCRVLLVKCGPAHERQLYIQLRTHL